MFSLTIKETILILVSEDYIKYKNNYLEEDKIVKQYREYMFDKTRTTETEILKEKKDLYINEKIEIIKQKYGEYWFLLNFNKFNNLTTDKLEKLKKDYIKYFKKIEFN